MVARKTLAVGLVAALLLVAGCAGPGGANTEGEGTDAGVGEETTEEGVGVGEETDEGVGVGEENGTNDSVGNETTGEEPIEDAVGNESEGDNVTTEDEAARGNDTDMENFSDEENVTNDSVTNDSMSNDTVGNESLDAGVDNESEDNATNDSTVDDNPAAADDAGLAEDNSSTNETETEAPV